MSDESRNLLLGGQLEGFNVNAALKTLHMSFLL